jgi:outer membrane protein assembly factor BamB
MRSRTYFAFAVLLSAFFGCVAIRAQEWTRFRGPNGTGFSDCLTIPVNWSDTDYVWKAKLPGTGHSSPVIWSDRLFAYSADAEKATLFLNCFNAKDGRVLWSRDFASKPHKIHDRNTYATSTPAVDDERVYLPWTTPEQLVLKAFDHDGKEVWSRDLGPWSGDHGFGNSPIVHGDLVILHNAQQTQELDPGQKPGQSSMIAVDRRTGRDVWKVQLPTVRTCFSTPMIRNLPDGNAELVCASTGNGIFGLDLKTGRQNWSVKVFDMRVVNSPVTASGLIFGSNGSGGYSGNYLVAVRPGPKAEEVYRLKNSKNIKAPYVTCMLPMEDVLFLIYDKGFAACIDAPTGKVRWLERTDGAFSGSPILVRDKIYCIDEEGVVWVIAADRDRYRLLARNPLGEPSRSTPAVSGGRMYLRTNSQLFCVGKKSEVASR